MPDSHPPHKPTISTATLEDIREARKRLQAQERACECCGVKFIPSRKWQMYCSSKCRNYMHNSNVQHQLAHYVEKSIALERQNSELEREIAELQTELAKRPGEE